jgi:WhiB family redox-sensing transcriptional regulator
MDNFAWQSRAACRGADTNLFYAPDVDTSDRKASGGSGLTERHVDALSYCGRCPVQAECRAWALEKGERGVWGGLTEHARKRLVTDRRDEQQRNRRLARQAS